MLNSDIIIMHFVFGRVNSAYKDNCMNYGTNYIIFECLNFLIELSNFIFGMTNIIIEEANFVIEGAHAFYGRTNS